jgi:hypothetical protein
MVLEHQTRASNLITYLGWEARVAEWHDRLQNTLTLNRPSAPALPPRVRRAARELVDYLLFVDEAPLADETRGTSGFAKRFSAQGPRDRLGRSLRELNLKWRLMRYPCSYMIYAPTFQALPESAKREVYRLIWRVLSGGEQGERYQGLSQADRQAVREILADTKNDLPPELRAHQSLSMRRRFTGF